MINETGIGARVINFIIDTLLVFFISYGFYKWWSFYVYTWGYTFISYYLFFIATIVVYYTLLEAAWGRTPGKYVSLSKVVNSKNKKPSLLISLVRSLIRLTIIDAFFIPFFNRPLHDHLTRTKVVEV